MIIETIEKITLDNLNENSVSVLTQQFAEINGETVQVGENHRRAYMNSKYGRIELEDKLQEPYLSSVLAVWGEEPTIVDDELDKLLGNPESDEETEVVEE